MLMRVAPQSALVGQSLADTHIGHNYDLWRAVCHGVALMGSGALLALLYLAAAFVSVTSSNAAAAVILAPIAAKAAEASGVELSHALLAVAYGCSCAFLVPFAHQYNLMVMGPGGYRNRDFLVVGGGLSVVTAITAVILLTLL